MIYSLGAMSFSIILLCLSYGMATVSFRQRERANRQVINAKDALIAALEIERDAHKDNAAAQAELANVSSALVEALNRQIAAQNELIEAIKSPRVALK